jgi:hypothetical protein
MKAEAFAVSAEGGAQTDRRGTPVALWDAWLAGRGKWLDQEGASVADQGMRLVDDGASVADQGMPLVDDGASLVESGVPPAVPARPSSDCGTWFGEHGASIANRRANHAEPCASPVDEHARHDVPCASQLVPWRRAAFAGATEALLDGHQGRRCAFVVSWSAFVAQLILRLLIG